MFPGCPVNQQRRVPPNPNACGDRNASESGPHPNVAGNRPSSNQPPNAAGGAQQPPPAKKKRKSSGSRRMRSNSEWRKDLIEMHKAMFERRANGKVPLFAHCSSKDELSQQCKRMAAHWKDLKLDECSSKGLDASDHAVVGAIHSKFELKAPPPDSGCNNNLDVEQAMVVAGAATTHHHGNTRRQGSKHEMRTNEQWRSLLMDVHTFLSSEKSWGRKPSIRSHCINVLKKETQCRRICDVWKELGLDAAPQDGIMPNDHQIKSKTEEKCPVASRDSAASAREANTTGGRDLRPASCSHFDEQEEAFMCEAVGAFARAGHPLERANLKQCADAFLEADSTDSGTIATGGVSVDAVERIYKNGRPTTKGNVNPIDPKRAAQADAQVLNVLCHQLDTWTKTAHEINPAVWPADRCANAVPTAKCNTDEQGPNSTQLRNPVLVPIEVIQDRERLFQNTREGDGKMQFHCTVANIARADGVQRHPDQSIEGAPAPHTLISDPSSSSHLDAVDKAQRDGILANQSDSDKTKLNPSVLEGWFDTFEVGNKDDVVNPLGFMIRATPTGGMLKRTFFDFMTHFTNQLPHNQGPSGTGVCLFLDWHSSRECPQSLITSFFAHNILMFVLPPKTSIWSQPCDSGKNELTAKDIAFAAHNQGLMAGKAMDCLDANKVFRAGLERNCTQQNEELLRTGTNAVVSSFKKTGLHPMDHDNEGWRMAIQNFGELNSLLRQQREEAGETIPNMTWVAKPKVVDQRDELSPEDVAVPNGFLPKDDFLGGEEDDDGQKQPIDVPPIVLSMAIADCLIGKHALDPNRDHNSPPTAGEDCEVVALKLIEFIAVTPDAKVDTTSTLSAEAIARDKLIAKLQATPFGVSIMLRKRESPDRVVNLMKQNPKQFTVLDGKRRPSRNLMPMSFQHVVNQCFDGNDDEEHALARKDKRKSQKKARIARKKCNETLHDDALGIANRNRLTRNINATSDKLTAKHPQFAARLATALEEEDLQMSDPHQEFEGIVMDPHEEVVSVTRDDITKDVSITTVGSNVSAASHKMETTPMKVMLEVKKAKSGGEKARRKRRRGPGQSTHLGRSGVSIGILLQRQRKEEEMAALQKEEKTVLDDLEKMSGVLEKVKQSKEQLPSTHWKLDAPKGKKRELLARLFDVHKSSAKAEEETNALKALELNKAKVDAKVPELEKRVSGERASIQPIIAERRGGEDFLQCTAEHAALAEEDDDSDDD